MNENYKLNGIIEDLEAKVKVLIEENDKLTDALEQRNGDQTVTITNLENTVSELNVFLQEKDSIIKQLEQSQLKVKMDCII